MATGTGDAVEPSQRTLSYHGLTIQLLVTRNGASGQDEELVAGERCLYWRESTDRFHTIKWKGPAVVVAVQLDPDTLAMLTLTGLPMEQC